MKKWIRRIMLAIATALVVLLGGAMVAVYLARSEPEYYHPPILTEAQRDEAAKSAEDKFIQIQNEAARVSAAGRVARREDRPKPQSGDITISFTEAELNSFFDKWSNFQNWKSAYQPYMTAPTIALRDGRLILAAKVQEIGLVVGLHFQADIDDHGKLNLQLARVMGGRLPLPQTVLQKYETQLGDEIAAKMPRWQANARLDANGGANTNAICAAMSKLFVHMLHRETSEPLLFLPVIGQKGSVPVKIIDVKITDGTITLIVRPLSQDEQAAMMEQIRENL